jgi:type IV pilus assembly protein PilC
MLPSKGFEQALKQRQAWQKTRVKERTSTGFQFWRSVRAREVTDFTRQLATMIQAKLPLTQVLDILSRQQSNAAFRDIIQNILNSVKRGESLSQGLVRYPKLFSPLYVNMVTVGEVSGNMSGILEQLAQYMEKISRLRRKILTAMAYPSVIVLVAIFAIGFMIFGVMPTFAEMFQDFNAEMPLPLKVLLGFGEFVKNYGLLLLIGVAVLTGLFRVYARTERGSWMLDTLKIRFFLIGHVIRKGLISRFARTLSTLLKSGVSLLDALDVTARSSGNRVVQKEVLMMKQAATKGQSMEKSLSGSTLFPELVVQMIAVGEETAELPEMLVKTADYYDSEVDAAIEALTSVIEPVIIVLLGVILGGTMITIYMQIFDLMNIIQ